MIDLIPYLPTGAILISALAAVRMTKRAINSQCKTARIKATLDLIVSKQASEYFHVLNEEFKSVRDSDGLMSILDNSHSSIKASKEKIQGFLNHYEIICIGFEKGILDEEFYYNYWRSNLVRHWEESENLIKRVQEKQPKAYVFFEKYAKSWQDERLINDVHKQ